MLTLKLKPGEYVDIGDDIRLVFTGGTVHNVHVLVEAPKDLAVYRSEGPKPLKGKASKKETGKGKSADEACLNHRAEDAEEPAEDLETRVRKIFEKY